MIVHLEYHPCISNINKNAIHGCCGSVYFVDSNCLEFRVSSGFKRIEAKNDEQLTLGVAYCCCHFQFRVPAEQWKNTCCLGHGENRNTVWVVDHTNKYGSPETTLKVEPPTCTLYRLVLNILCQENVPLQV